MFQARQCSIYIIGTQDGWPIYSWQVGVQTFKVDIGTTLQRATRLTWSRAHLQVKNSWAVVRNRRENVTAIYNREIIDKHKINLRGVGFIQDASRTLHQLRKSMIDRQARSPRFSAAGMVRMKNHEKSGWVHLIWNPGQVLTAECRETPGRARTFISDQSKEVSPDRERRRKLHRCIQTAIDSARRLFFQTFQPSFVISWPISTNEPSLESLKSQQNNGAIFVPMSPRKRTIAPFLRRVLTLSAQFPRIRICSGQINLCRGEIAVDSFVWLLAGPPVI